MSGAEEDDLEDDTPLVGEDIMRYRGIIARCNYLGADRPDALFASRRAAER